MNNDLNKRRRKIVTWCWLFMMPAIILFLTFQAWPIIQTFRYSLFDWSGIGNNMRFSGFDNYKELLKDTNFWRAIKNNYWFTLWVVPLQMIIGLVLAVVLNSGNSRWNNVYRTAFFLPVVTTSAIIGIILGFVFSFDGPVTLLLSSLGLCKPGTSWLAKSDTAMGTTIAIYVWKNVGTSMIYWLAGLQSIPQDLYDSAEIDGCNKLKCFRYITLPLLVPIGLVIGLLNLISSLKLFDLVKTLTNGGPFYSTDVIALFIYRYAFSADMGSPRIGYASAAAMLFGITTLIVVGSASLIVKGIQAATGLKKEV